MSTTIAHKVAVCAAHLLLKDGAVVLDAGCADGLATAWLAQCNPRIHVIGLDYDGGFIAKARERFAHLPNLEFIEADLRDFDLAVFLDRLSRADGEGNPGCGAAQPLTRRHHHQSRLHAATGAGKAGLHGVAR